MKNTDKGTTFAELKEQKEREFQEETGQSSPTTIEVNLPTEEPLLPFPPSAFRGVFADYRNATQGINEVCDEFNFASALVNVGVILGKRAGLTNGDLTLYPNFYAVLVGKTGASRKSTAISQAKRIFAGCDPNVRYLSQLASPEGLIEQLTPPSPLRLKESIKALEESDEFLKELESMKSSEIVDAEKFALEQQINELNEQIARDQAMFQSINPQLEGIRLLVELDEFSALLKKSRKSGSEGLIDTITTLYSTPLEIDLPTRHNPLTAHNPILALIGCATMAWLENSMNQEDVHGGFANRFIYFLSPETEPEPIPRPRPPREQDVETICEMVENVRQELLWKQEPSRFDFDDEAGAIIDEWYIELTHRKRAEEHPLKSSAIQRIDTHVKKIALTYAVMENASRDCFIHPEQVQAAIDVGEYLYSTASKVFGDYSPNIDAKVENKIIEKLGEKGPLTKRLISQMLSSTTSALERNRAIDSLIQAEIIIIEEPKGDSRKSPLLHLVK